MAGQQGQLRSTSAHVNARLQDPHFVRAVAELMKDEKACETFAFFDTDGSGYISAQELEPLVSMFNPHHTEADVAAMIHELDLNRDGEVDLWEFCVQMQIMRERNSAADAEFEVDQAFHLFKADETGRIDTHELRRIFMAAYAGSALSEEEFQEMLDDLGIEPGDALDLHNFRAHPAFSASAALLMDEAAAPAPTHRHHFL